MDFVKSETPALWKILTKENTSEAYTGGNKEIVLRNTVKEQGLWEASFAKSGG